jgi:hypothetical protein
MVQAQKAQGVDLTIFETQLSSGDLYPAPAYADGAPIQTTVAPMFEAYLSGSTGGSVFNSMYIEARKQLGG